MLSFITAGKPSDEKTHVDYIPTLFSHVSSPQKRKQQKKVESHERMVKRKRVMQANMEESTVSTSTVTDNVASTSQNLVQSQSTEDDPEVVQLQGERVKQIFLEGLLKHSMQKKEEAERELEQVKNETVLLKKELEQARNETEHARKEAEQSSLKVELFTLEMEQLKQNQFTMETLEKSNEKVLFFTGLPKFSILRKVFELALKVLPTSRVHGNRVLDNFSEFLMTLMKLRLNLKNKDLAYRFGVCESVVTHTVHKWLNILYMALKFLIRWPDRDELRKTLPECFRGQFDKVVVIIDCTEVYIERATNVLARSQTWSNYKSHNTVKYLIGITPQGTVSFVSEGWGGRVSDKAITKESGILNKLLPGDMVMADRGFNIADLVAEYRAEAILPAFTRGKTQLSSKEVLESRAVARVRIHVERLIGMVKKIHNFGWTPSNKFY